MAIVKIVKNMDLDGIKYTNQTIGGCNWLDVISEIK